MKRLNSIYTHHKLCFFAKYYVCKWHHQPNGIFKAFPFPRPSLITCGIETGFGVYISETRKRKKQYIIGRCGTNDHSGLIRVTFLCVEQKNVSSSSTAEILKHKIVIFFGPDRPLSTSNSFTRVAFAQWRPKNNIQKWPNIFPGVETKVAERSKVSVSHSFELAQHYCGRLSASRTWIKVKIVLIILLDKPNA